MNLTDPQDREAAAGEYVLGTLDDGDRQAFAQALESDPDLLAMVYRWQDRLLPLAERVPAVEAPATLWARIRDAAFPAAAITPVRAVPATVAANDDLWRSLRRWQFSAMAASMATVVLAGALWWPREAPAPVVRYVVVLQAPDTQKAGWVVEAQPGQGVRLVPVADSGAVPEGKALQFWTKPVGAKGPTSLGLVQAGQRVNVPMDQLPGLSDQQLFELTLEPATGSPIDRPTGPILYVGRAIRL